MSDSSEIKKDLAIMNSILKLRERVAFLEGVIMAIIQDPVVKTKLASGFREKR